MIEARPNSSISVSQLKVNLAKWCILWRSFSFFVNVTEQKFCFINIRVIRIFDICIIRKKKNSSVPASFKLQQLILTEQIMNFVVEPIDECATSSLKKNVLLRLPPSYPLFLHQDVSLADFSTFVFLFEQVISGNHFTQPHLHHPWIFELSVY